MKKFFCLAVIVVSAAGAAAQHAVKGEFKETLRAKLDPALKSYKPSMKVEGEIRSIGADTMEDLTKFWIEGFTKSHPNAKFTVEAKASGTAVPALTDGKADVGPCAREVLPPELGPFEKKFGYKPFAVRVASGSYRTPGKTHAIAFLVNKDNPIKHLTFAQIDSLYAASPSEPAITTWGQLCGASSDRTGLRSSSPSARCEMATSRQASMSGRRWDRSPHSTQWLRAWPPTSTRSATEASAT